MYYVHFDNNGRPDMFTEYKSISKKKAIEYCKSLQHIAYVSELVGNTFKPYIFKNKDEYNKTKV